MQLLILANRQLVVNSKSSVFFHAISTFCNNRNRHWSILGKVRRKCAGSTSGRHMINSRSCQQRSCWKCKKGSIPSPADSFCRNPTCGVIQPMDTSVNYYDILRLSKGGDGGGGDGGVAKFTPRTSMRSLFDVDLVELRQQFLKSQQKLHPDTFSQKTEEERLYSEQQSSFANKAYQTLKNPLLRAKYLLFLHGEPLEESSLEEKLNPVMLMMVMDVREALEDATTLSQVRKLASSNDLRYERTCAKISKGFAVNDLNAVRKDVIELQYWDSIRRAIEDKMDEELDEE